jgi:dTDP-glucose 4,6-dehydratase
MSLRVEPGVRALVTGGAGFIGARLCAALRQHGADVVGVDNLVTGSLDNLRDLLEDDGFILVKADLGSGIGNPAKSTVDVVFHLASPASPKDYLRLPLETMRVGAHGTEHALDLADQCGARFLLASTSEVYGDPLEHPQTERYWGNVNPIGPRSVYDEAKRYAEALTMAYRRSRGTDTTIARIFNTYGPGMRADDGRMIPAFVHQGLAGEPITVTGDGKQTRSICYVDDTVRGLLALAESGVAGPVNIGNPVERTVLELARKIRVLTGDRSEIRHVPAMVDDPARRCPDITTARTELGWSPTVGPDEGIARTVAWFAEKSGAEPSLRSVAD